MSKASTDSLNELHGAIAEALKRRIASGEATAADLNVARQFLKDNGIEALPGTNKAVQDLAAVLPFPEPGERPVKVS